MNVMESSTTRTDFRFAFCLSAATAGTLRALARLLRKSYQIRDVQYSCTGLPSPGIAALAIFSTRRVARHFRPVFPARPRSLSMPNAMRLPRETPEKQNRCKIRLFILLLVAT